MLACNKDQVTCQNFSEHLRDCQPNTAQNAYLEHSTKEHRLSEIASFEIRLGCIPKHGEPYMC